MAGGFCGSGAWWLPPCLLAGLVRAHLTDGRRRVVNLVAGSLVIALGLWALIPPGRAWLA